MPDPDALTTETAETPNDCGKDDGPSASGNAALPMSRYFLFAGLAIAGGGIDLWSKEVIFRWRDLPGRSDVYWVIEGYFGIETAVNIGAVFGIGAGKGTLFAAISVVALASILIWLFRFGAAQSKWLTFALGCITGGIIGNLYDRLGLWWQPDYPEPWRSGVRDWILWQASDQWRWPNFNIADSLLVTGAIMLVVQSVFFPPDFMIGKPEDAVEPTGNGPAA